MNIAAVRINRRLLHGSFQITAREPMEQDRSNSELVDLSHDSILMTEALACAHNAPDTRQERIDALKARIAAGEYEIDSLELASNIIRENPGLFRK